MTTAKPSPRPEEKKVVASLKAMGFLWERMGEGWGYRNLDDRALEHVQGLTSITCLDLQFSQASDEGVSYLAGSTSLKTLRLGRGITDAGLAHLAGLTQLTELRLENAGGVTDAGLTHVARLTNLEGLSLQYTAVGDEGLKALAHLVKLKDLVLCGSKITDAGLVHLAGMTGLRQLALSYTAITDAGLEHLGSLKDLENLWLAKLKITDAATPLLCRFAKLSLLDLSKTKMTRAGKREVKKALPMCTLV